MSFSYKVSGRSSESKVADFREVNTIVSGQSCSICHYRQLEKAQVCAGSPSTDKRAHNREHVPLKAMVKLMSLLFVAGVTMGARTPLSPASASYNLMRRITLSTYSNVAVHGHQAHSHHATGDAVIDKVCKQEAKRAAVGDLALEVPLQAMYCITEEHPSDQPA